MITSKPVSRCSKGSVLLLCQATAVTASLQQGHSVQVHCAKAQTASTPWGLHCLTLTAGDQHNNKMTDRHAHRTVVAGVQCNSAATDRRASCLGIDKQQIDMQTDRLLYRNSLLMVSTPQAPSHSLVVPVAHMKQHHRGRRNLITIWAAQDMSAMC